MATKDFQHTVLFILLNIFTIRHHFYWALVYLEEKPGPTRKVSGKYDWSVCKSAGFNKQLSVGLIQSHAPIIISTEREEKPRPTRKWSGKYDWPLCKSGVFNKQLSVGLIQSHAPWLPTKEMSSEQQTRQLRSHLSRTYLDSSYSYFFNKKSDSLWQTLKKLMKRVTTQNIVNILLNGTATNNTKRCTNELNKMLTRHPPRLTTSTGEEEPWDSSISRAEPRQISSPLKW